MNPQLEGVEDIVGTYVFDLRTSHRALKLNRFFWNMIRAEYRQRFLEDQQKALDDAGLDDTEKALVNARDWLGLVQHGANFFVLEKFARVVKKTNMEVYAIMRGESFEEFLATRQVPGAR
jgi:protocatechuate 4,5-dioxygenase alpha subunit